MSDLISRQDVIDAILNADLNINVGNVTVGRRTNLSQWEAIAVIKKIPSQPTQDCISRQEAIDALNGEIEITGRANAEAVKGYGRLVKDRLERLPSAEPMRKKGTWKEVYAETDYRNGWIEFTCECCEYQHGLESGEYGWYYGDEIPWKFCPVCGAEMREGGEDEQND